MSLVASALRWAGKKTQHRTKGPGKSVSSWWLFSKVAQAERVEVAGFCRASGSDGRASPPRNHRLTRRTKIQNHVLKKPGFFHDESCAAPSSGRQTVRTRGCRSMYCQNLGSRLSRASYCSYSVASSAKQLCVSCCFFSS